MPYALSLLTQDRCCPNLNLNADERCPICQETFLSCIALEEMAYAMDTPAMSPYDYGVTKLPKCGHIFCRKEYVTKSRRYSCTHTQLTFVTDALISLSKWIISAVSFSLR